MEQLASESMAVLFVSSDMEEILGMADRTIVMHEGKITGELARDELSEEEKLRLKSPVDGFRKNDRIRFVSPTSSAQNQPVRLTADGQTIELKSGAFGVSADNFFAVPIKRTSLMSIPLAIISVLALNHVVDRYLSRNVDNETKATAVDRNALWIAGLSRVIPLDEQ